MTDIEMREQLRSDLDRVNFWISNADQKASTILAVIGVVVPIVGSTDKVIDIIICALKPVIDAIKCNDCWPILNLGLATLMAVSVFYLSRAIYHLLKTISTSINPKVFKEDGLNVESLLHFQSVNKRSYTNYEKQRLSQLKSMDEENKDYLSQIYINSDICTTKFLQYSEGLQNLRVFLRWLLVTSIVLIVHYIYVN